LHSDLENSQAIIVVTPPKDQRPLADIVMHEKEHCLLELKFQDAPFDTLLQKEETEALRSSFSNDTS
jgi:hypothetical protein